MPRHPPQLLTQAQALIRRCRSAYRQHARRARAAGQALDYDAGDLADLARAAVTCWFCRAPLGLDFQFDHVIPTGRGGRHARGNLCCACARCNAIKGILTVVEFAGLLDFLRGLHPAAARDLERRLLAGSAVYARGRS